MGILEGFLDIVTNLDMHMAGIMLSYGALTYLLIFLVIFLQTGLIIAPFLPGDALIFIIGTMCVSGGFNIWLSAAVLITAAIAGDNLNYCIGRALGPRLFRRENARFFKRGNLDRAHAFYERQGGKMIIAAHFVGVVRTFMPFVAGMGRMTYRKFLTFSTAGAVLWIGLFLVAGYFLGKRFEDDLEYLIFAIIILTSVPGVVAWIREKRKGRERGKAGKKSSGVTDPV